MPLNGTLLNTFSPATVARRVLQQPEVDLEPVVAFSVEDADLSQAPPRAPDDQPGSPSMRGVTRIRSHDGRITTGVWDCEAGVFQVAFLCDEVVHILEGEVIVRANGTMRFLRPGDVALFRAGMSATWDVPRYVRKLWFHHHPKPTIRDRIEYKLRMWMPLVFGRNR